MLRRALPENRLGGLRASIPIYLVDNLIMKRIFVLHDLGVGDLARSLVVASDDTQLQREVTFT